ncbi:MAG: hypothetical protein JXA72_14315 [Bacteroidales bacterium]|nr:hypothetical protein [Bacteroidales bacterium]
MKKTVIILASLMISALVGAQGINLSGSWKLNSSKSKLNAEFSMAPKSINMTQNGNSLSVEKHSEFQGQEMVSTDKLTLDGKECINPGFMDSQKKSTAVWSDDKKSLKVTSKIAMGDGNEMVITEIYKLDGTSLVIDSSSSSSFGEMAETMVYDK